MNQFRIREKFIPYNLPNLTDQEVNAVIDTLKSSWIAKGPRTVKFEQQFAQFVGAKHAIATNSGTAALHLALLSKGIGSGDEVITTPNTFASTANTIIHVGAKPVFADIDYRTGCIDPSEIEKKITPRTKAIVPVHYSGQVCDLDQIYEIADKYSLFVSEDAAHALGSYYKGKTIGNHTKGTASYSFYATKNLTTGEGGMLVTDDDEIDAKARIWAGQGMSQNAWNRYSKDGKWQYDICEPGFKYNMFDIQAALGLVQLSRMNKMQAKRKKIAEKYQNEFSRIDAVEPPYIPDYTIHSWHLYIIRIVPELLTINRDRFIIELNKRNIGTSVHFIPVTSMSYYQKRYGFKKEDFPNTEKNYERIISLPLYPSLSDEETDYIIDAVRNIVEEYHK
ncbi:DegT/DnrJ/EryC1/StrS family aminotransferase [Caproicibacter fermentans]|uniref:DegT/DnrJ/EryC1/StrS aminotransferase family protein n=1 Tax=Caproicibacter fermentans TaxID=2576756 RepID=A0A7G8T8H8_9FIRM|nr:DegT/DnrJ/EryC1/StrS aminotransferase family protein [Caproicibacter fermentans]QNK39919.1 DegT/DnrJ/EryC1/StrS aminotransferase family protein [Caproicibacter fermentans]